MTTPVNRVAAFALLSALAFASTGCGSKSGVPTVEVTGKVTYEGKPLEFGSVLFMPTAGGPTAKANINSDGTYALGTYADDDGAIAGSHKIMILSIKEPAGSGLAEEAIKKKFDGAPVSVIPERYGDRDASKLVAEVKPGQPNKIDFILTKEKGEVVSQ